jgi:hypothetical protein
MEGGETMPDSSSVKMSTVAVYELRIQGRLDASWINQMQADTISVLGDADQNPVTVLTATFRDQAELRGLLDRIYNLNLPLISVHHIRNR